MNRQTLIIILSSVIVFLLILQIQSCEKRQREDKFNKALNIALNDTLSKIRNRDSSQTAKIALLQVQTTKQLLEIQTRDETIKELQAELKKNSHKLKEGGSVAVIHTGTTFSSTTRTDSVKSVANSCNPTYYSSSKDTTWIKYNIAINKDSTIFKLKTKDAYTVVIGQEKIGFRKFKPIVEVTSKNPYTDIKSLRAVEVKDTRKISRISLGGQIGYGMTIGGLSPYLGIGLNFRII